MNKPGKKRQKKETHRVGKQKAKNPTINQSFSELHDKPATGLLKDLMNRMKASLAEHINDIDKIQAELDTQDNSNGFQQIKQTIKKGKCLPPNQVLDIYQQLTNLRIRRGDDNETFYCEMQSAEKNVLMQFRLKEQEQKVTYIPSAMHLENRPDNDFLWHELTFPSNQLNNFFKVLSSQLHSDNV